jgi:tetratricopeptide (TPR) repeat protein
MLFPLVAAIFAVACVGRAAFAAAPAQGIEAAERRTVLEPNNAAAWRELGLRYEGAGETAMATRAYEQAVRLDPRDGDSLEALGGLYAQAGQKDKLRQTWQRLDEVDKKRAERFFSTYLLPPGEAAPPATAAASPPSAATGASRLRQGGHWEYSYRDTRNFRAALRRFEIVQANPVEIVEQVQLETGKRLIDEHHEGAYLDMRAGMQFAPYYFAFQDAPPSGWIDSVKVEGGAACDHWSVSAGWSAGDCRVRAHFLGSASVHVQAGTFDAQRVHVTVDQYGAERGHSQHWHIADADYWYSPAAGRVVRAVISHEDGQAWTETMELVSYQK